MDETPIESVDVAPEVDAPAAPEAPAVDAPAEGAPVLAASDEGVEVVADETPVHNELWNEEQFTAWDGAKETLDERYHPVYDRVSSAHTDIQAANSTLERQLSDANETIKALTWGEPDPQVNQLREAASGHEAALAEANSRVEAAEARILELQAEYEGADQAKAEVDIARFHEKHAWAMKDDTPKPVKQAIAKMLDTMTPVEAGDVFAGKSAAFQTAAAESILRGDSVATAMELAGFRTSVAKPKPAPKPLPGGDLINGAAPAGNTSTRKRTIYEANSAKEARGMMADSMFR